MQYYILGAAFIVHTDGGQFNARSYRTHRQIATAHAQRWRLIGRAHRSDVLLQS